MVLIVVAHSLSLSVFLTSCMPRHRRTPVFKIILISIFLHYKGNTAGCKYERKVSDCVDNKKTISFNSVSGGADCPQKEPKEKPCGRGGRNRKEKKAERKARRNERRNQRNNGGQS